METPEAARWRAAETHQVSPTDVYVAGSLFTYVPAENELFINA